MSPNKIQVARPPGMASWRPEGASGSQAFVFQNSNLSAASLVSERESTRRNTAFRFLQIEIGLTTQRHLSLLESWRQTSLRRRPSATHRHVPRRRSRRAAARGRRPRAPDCEAVLDQSQPAPAAEPGRAGALAPRRPRPAPRACSGLGLGRPEACHDARASPDTSHRVPTIANDRGGIRLHPGSSHCNQLRSRFAPRKFQNVSVLLHGGWRKG